VKVHKRAIVDPPANVHVKADKKKRCTVGVKGPKEPSVVHISANMGDP